MRRVLISLSLGFPADSHCREQSDYGGLTATVAALRRRGLIDGEDKLTTAGHQVARFVEL